jgi:hypothetical protein
MVENSQFLIQLMKVFVGQGYYDLATPHFATEYMISHMNIDNEFRNAMMVCKFITFIKQRIVLFRNLS